MIDEDLYDKLIDKKDSKKGGGARQRQLKKARNMLVRKLKGFGKKDDHI